MDTQMWTVEGRLDPPLLGRHTPWVPMTGFMVGRAQSQRGFATAAVRVFPTREGALLAAAQWAAEQGGPAQTRVAAWRRDPVTEPARVWSPGSEEMPVSNLVKHARAELARLAEEEPALKASVLKAVEGFASYPGHSGGSAEVARQMVARLLSFQALSPLTADPAEWQDRTEQSGYPLWQNTRDSTAFSDDGGRTYWLLAEGDSAPRHTSVAP